MKKLIVFASVFAAVVAANAEDFYTNVTVTVNGQQKTFRARRLSPDLDALEKAHGKVVGIEKDPLNGEVVWVFADNYRETRKIPKFILNNPQLFSTVNRDKIQKYERLKASKKEEVTK